MLMTPFELSDENDRAFILDLYNSHYAFVRKTIFNITKENKDIEDLINDVFIKLIEKLPVLKMLNKYKTVTYVYYTAKSIAINHIIHRDIENKHLYYGLDKDLSECFISDECSLESKILNDSEFEALGRTILNLPQKQRDLLNYKYILELTDTEIGELIGIAANSVREYLTRARHDAKTLIKEEKEVNGK